MKCLKGEILRSYKHLFREAACRVCETPYRMNVVGVKKFMPSLGWEQSKDKYPLLCLLATFFFLLLMLVLVAVQLNSVLATHQTKDGFFYSPVALISIIAFLLLILLLIGWFIVMILKNMLFIDKIYTWTILDLEEYTEKPAYQAPKRQDLNILQQNVEIDQQGVLKVKKASVVHESPSSPPLRKSKTVVQKLREDEGNMFGILSDQQAAMLTRQKKKKQQSVYYSAPKNKKKDSKKDQIRSFSDEDN